MGVAYSVGEAISDRHHNPTCLACNGTGKRNFYGARICTDRLLCLMCNGFGFLPSKAQRERATQPTGGR